MAESDGRASGYLMDLINFLRSTFQVFTHLPVSLAKHAQASGGVTNVVLYTSVEGTDFCVCDSDVVCRVGVSVSFTVRLSFFFPVDRMSF